MVVRYQSIIAVSPGTNTNFNIKPRSLSGVAAYRPPPQATGEKIQAKEKFYPSSLALCFQPSVDSYDLN
jgi:hypothetical protein